MSIDTVIVTLIVVVALLYVGRRAWKTLHASKGGKGGCDNCH